MRSTSSNGFTVVEVLVTLFVATIFVVAGYQLYMLIAKNSAGAADRSEALILADSYLNQETNSIKACQTVNQTLINSSNNNKVYLSVTSPYGCNTDPIIKVTITVDYFNINHPAEIVKSRYVNLGSNGWINTKTVLL